MQGKSYIEKEAQVKPAFFILRLLGHPVRVRMKRGKFPHFPKTLGRTVFCAWGGNEKIN